MQSMDPLSPRRTGRADFPHPALTQTLAPSQYARQRPRLAEEPSRGLR